MLTSGRDMRKPDIMKTFHDAQAFTTPSGKRTSKSK